MTLPASRLMADISNNNLGFDAHAYRAAGHGVVAIKATEGVGGLQRTHALWADAAHRAGVKVVHYHFAHPDTHRNGIGEALDFLRAVEAHWRRGDRVCVDVELQAAAGVDTNAYIESFVGTLRRHRTRGGLARVGVAHGWLYTGTFYAREHGLRLPRGWRLWLADYSNPVLGARFGMRPWAHQFTDGDHGPLPHGLAGVRGPCDVSALSRRAAAGLWLG